jgi:cytochrome c553
MKVFYLRFACLYTLTAGIFAGAAFAEPLQGKQLAAQCAQCHATNGSGGFLVLAGRNSGSLYKQLLTMKSRSTPQSIMDLQARGYTDAQLLQISEYFSSLPKKSGSTSTPGTGCNPRSPKC